MKRQKYGYIYRTHLFGNPTVRVTGAENVRHILLGEHKLVSVQWPASVRTILGSDTLSNVHGAQHKIKKKVWHHICNLCSIISGNGNLIVIVDIINCFPNAVWKLSLTKKIIYNHI